MEYWKFRELFGAKEIEDMIHGSFVIKRFLSVQIVDSKMIDEKCHFLGCLIEIRVNVPWCAICIYAQFDIQAALTGENSKFEGERSSESDSFLRLEQHNMDLAHKVSVTL